MGHDVISKIYTLASHFLNLNVILNGHCDMKLFLLKQSWNLGKIPVFVITCNFLVPLIFKFNGANFQYDAANFLSKVNQRLNCMHADFPVNWYLLSKTIRQST